MCPVPVSRPQKVRGLRGRRYLRRLRPSCTKHYLPTSTTPCTEEQGSQSAASVQLTARLHRRLLGCIWRALLRAMWEGQGCVSFDPIGNPHLCSELPVPVVVRARKLLSENTGRTWHLVWLCATQWDMASVYPLGSLLRKVGVYLFCR